MVFPLFAISDDGRAGRLESGDGIPDRFPIEGLRPSSMPSPQLAMASISACGRGMLPMGSVGITIVKLLDAKRRRAATRVQANTFSDITTSQRRKGQDGQVYKTKEDTNWSWAIGRPLSCRKPLL
jgi:hypothetical protein